MAVVGEYRLTAVLLLFVLQQNQFSKRLRASLHDFPAVHPQQGVVSGGRIERPSLSKGVSKPTVNPSPALTINYLIPCFSQ